MADVLLWVFGGGRMASILAMIEAASNAAWMRRLRAVADHGDELDVKQLTILACSALGAPQLCIWAGFYVYFGHTVPGVVLLVYALATAAGVAVCCVNF